jgi:ornithine carbamoyltransferase
MRHFLNLIDHSAETLQQILTRATQIKSGLARGERIHPLANKIVSLVFEKPSLRTRVSFEAAVTQLGGTSLFQSGSEVGLGNREPLCDFARTMSQYVDAIILRVFKQSTVGEVAKFASVPVVNGLSDISHPCQAMADFQTMIELFGSLQGRTIVFVGDGNNVARSLAVGAALLGVNFILSSPQGYNFPADFLERLKTRVKGQVQEIRDPVQAVKNADIIYADVWTSMGQESEKDVRLKQFVPYQINAELLKKAPSHAKVLHCLPAHRGEEITAEVMEAHAGPIFQQAGNRLHAQKAILEWLFAG